MTSANSGNVNGTLTFAGFQNLVGGAGTNTLDYLAYENPVTVNLVTNTATGINSFANIQRLVGSPNIDTLIGPNNSNNWTINGIDSGTIGTIPFFWFENLIGGTQDDTFTFAANGSVTSIDGGAGTNTLGYIAVANATVNLATLSATGVTSFANIQNLVGSSDTTLVGPNTATTWNITGLSAGTVVGYQFSAISNLAGGSADDRFVFADGAMMYGTIDGNAGTDTLDYSAYTTNVAVNLQTGTATGTGGLRNIEILIGGSGNNTLTGANADNAWQITGANAGSVDGTTFTGFGILTGGTANDTFVFADGASVTGRLDGGAGLNALDYSAYTTSVTVNLLTGTATGTNGVANIQKVIGGHGDDTLIGGNNVTFGFGDNPGHDTITSGAQGTTFDFSAMTNPLVFTIGTTDVTMNGWHEQRHVYRHETEFGRRKRE